MKNSIFFDDKTIPVQLKETFEQYGYLTLWNEESEYVLNIADLHLYLFLSYPQQIEGLKFRYYSNYDFDRETASEPLPNSLLEKALNEFIAGYRQTHTKKNYEQQLEDAIWPLSRSDENIRKYTLKLLEDIHPMELDFIPFNIERYNNFRRLGQKHGFYTLLKDIIQKHGWAPKMRNKEQSPQIEKDKLEALAEQLSEARVLVDGQLNSKSGPVIAELITKLKSRYTKASRVDILEMIRPILNSDKPEKDFKLSKAPKRKAEYVQLAEGIFTSVFR